MYEVDDCGVSSSCYLEEVIEEREVVSEVFEEVSAVDEGSFDVRWRAESDETRTGSSSHALQKGVMDSLISLLKNWGMVRCSSSRIVLHQRALRRARN